MYRVEWLQAALDELSILWLDSSSEMRRAVTAATQTLDQPLVADRCSQGELREGKFRVLFESPLGVQVEVDADNYVLEF